MIRTDRNARVVRKLLERLARARSEHIEADQKGFEAQAASDMESIIFWTNRYRDTARDITILAGIISGEGVE